MGYAACCFTNPVNLQATSNDMTPTATLPRRHQSVGLHNLCYSIIASDILNGNSKPAFRVSDIIVQRFTQFYLSNHPVSPYLDMAVIKMSGILCLRTVPFIPYCGSCQV